MTRDVEANTPTAAQPPNMMTRDDMKELALCEFVTRKNISIKGKGILDSKTLSRSPEQNSITRVMAKPAEPLMSMLKKMDLGTVSEGLCTSSDI